jgi:hypothetical protein
MMHREVERQREIAQREMEGLRESESKGKGEGDTERERNTQREIH